MTSSPEPPSKVSFPPNPLIVSLPSNPLIVLALLFPVRVSLNLEPVRFSILVSVSVPAPTVFCAELVFKETVTPAVASM